MFVSFVDGIMSGRCRETTILRRRGLGISLRSRVRAEHLSMYATIVGGFLSLDSRIAKGFEIEDKSWDS